MIRLVVAFTALLVGASPGTSAHERYAGAYALATGAPNATAMLDVARTSPLAAQLAIVERSGGRVVRRYDTEMTKAMHLIAISDDFASFLHVHPALRGDGRFAIDLHVPKAGRYYLYADATPHGGAQQVFRFTVPFGDARAAAKRLDATGTRVDAGPYTVALDALALHAGRETQLGVTILKGGRPAGDLHAYLGGAAHAVFVNASTLAYVHVHPVQGAASTMDAMPAMKGMAMAGESAPLPQDAHVASTMTLHVRVPANGIYKLWLQFRGGNRVYVAPFVLAAR